MMVKSIWCLTTSLLLVSILLQEVVHVTANNTVANIVLVGATGDLARKYLWEALFVGFVENSFNQDIRIYGAATRRAEEGTNIINAFIDNLHCKDTWSVSVCSEGMEKFKDRVQYVQLKSEANFQSLQEVLTTPEEALRVVYLSVSPSLYEGLVTSIDKYLRPSNNAELRVVFEKPFGRDYVSAKKLSTQLSKHLTEEEIFRVDHYLGKVGMQAIINFRKLNSNLLDSLGFPSARGVDELSSVVQAESLATGDDIILRDYLDVKHASVSVVMKEMDDTAGRSRYYDQYGVIRDVFQNHLTQALVYALMAVDVGSTYTFGKLNDRLHILNSLEYESTYSLIDENSKEASCLLRSPSSSLEIYQYKDYKNHLKEDYIEYATRYDKNALLDEEELTQAQKSLTPTAARVNYGVLLPTTPSSKMPVAIAISGGKALETREMVVHLKAQHDPINADNVDICSVVFGVQGNPQRHLLSNPSTTALLSGPYIILKGSCWSLSDSNISTIILPEEWVVDEAYCSPNILQKFNLASPLNRDDSADDEPVDGVCLIRPQILSAKEKNEPVSGADMDNKGHEHSAAYLNNAYIEIMKALMINDRSYFTTTEELLSQWKLWNPVLVDSECAEHSSSEITSGIKMQEYDKGSLTLD